MSSEESLQRTEQPFWSSRGFTVGQLGMGIILWSVIIKSELAAKIWLSIAVVGFTVFGYDYVLPQLREVA
jgi:hypothetical protein